MKRSIKRISLLILFLVCFFLLVYAYHYYSSVKEENEQLIDANAFALTSAILRIEEEIEELDHEKRELLQKRNEISSFIESVEIITLYGEVAHLQDPSSSMCFDNGLAYGGSYYYPLELLKKLSRFIVYDDGSHVGSRDMSIAVAELEVDIEYLDNDFLFDQDMIILNNHFYVSDTYLQGHGLYLRFNKGLTLSMTESTPLEIDDVNQYLNTLLNNNEQQNNEETPYSFDSKYQGFSVSVNDANQASHIVLDNKLMTIHIVNSEVKTIEIYLKHEDSLMKTTRLIKSGNYHWYDPDRKLLLSSDDPSIYSYIQLYDQLHDDYFTSE